MLAQVRPPSVDSWSWTPRWITFSGSFGLHRIWPKYHGIELRVLVRRQLAPASSDRYTPPSRPSATAYSVAGCDRQTSMPSRPTGADEKPSVSRVQVFAPSVVFQIPLSGPPPM